MTPPNLKRISKFMSLVLRHRPESIGLELDENGWVDVAELIAKMNAADESANVTQELIAEVVRTNDKKRFSFSDDGIRIRANQGHSIKVDLGFKPAQPPKVLYHGTATRFLESIMNTGLEKRGRQHVHLSAEKETAVKVGQRHGKPVVLTIDTEAMLKAGHVFFLSENGVWLCEHVPPEFLSTLN